VASSSFRTTRWSVVLDATRAEPSRAALESLCRAYWYPLYAFARRQGRSHEDAHDLVQGFFARLLEKNDWRVAPERGRFRAFLLAALRNYAANERQRELAEKRGGGARVVSIDADADSRYAIDAVDPSTPDKLYERKFALQLLDGALAELAAEQERAGKGAQFERLKMYLSGAVDDVPYEQVAAGLAMSAGAVRVAVHRLRKRFGELVRRAVADLVESPDEVEDEIRALLDALAD
jgi:RNA polymerase sigma factor (sigma-70 family)